MHRRRLVGALLCRSSSALLAQTLAPPAFPPRCYYCRCASSVASHVRTVPTALCQLSFTPPAILRLTVPRWAAVAPPWQPRQRWCQRHRPGRRQTGTAASSKRRLLNSSSNSNSHSKLKEVSSSRSSSLALHLAPVRARLRSICSATAEVTTAMKRRQQLLMELRNPIRKQLLVHHRRVTAIQRTKPSGGVQRARRICAVHATRRCTNKRRRRRTSARR